MSVLQIGNLDVKDLLLGADSNVFHSHEMQAIAQAGTSHCSEAAASVDFS